LDPRHGHLAKTQYYHEQELQMLMQQREANAALKKQDMDERIKRDTARLYKEKEAKAKELGIENFKQHLNEDGTLTNPMGELVREAHAWADSDEGKRITATIEAEKSKLQIEVSDEARRQLGTDTGALRDATARIAANLG
jgi:hypothetical protein